MIKPKDVLQFTVPKEIEFKLIDNTNNLGIQRSRIKGLNASTGDYIIFLDQDDRLITKNYIYQIKNKKFRYCRR